MTKVEKELLDKLGNVRNQLIDLRDKYKNIHHVTHDSTIAGLNRIISETFIAIEMNTGNIVHNFFEINDEKTKVMKLSENVSKQITDIIKHTDIGPEIFTEPKEGYDINIKKSKTGEYIVTLSPLNP